MFAFTQHLWAKYFTFALSLFPLDKLNFRTFLLNDQHSIQFNFIRPLLCSLFFQAIALFPHFIAIGIVVDWPFFCFSYYTDDISCRWWRYVPIFFSPKKKTSKTRQLRRWCFTFFLRCVEYITSVHKTMQMRWQPCTVGIFLTLVRCNKTAEYSAAHLVFFVEVTNHNVRGMQVSWSMIKSANRKITIQNGDNDEIEKNYQMQ